MKDSLSVASSSTSLEDFSATATLDGSSSDHPIDDNDDSSLNNETLRRRYQANRESSSSSIEITDVDMSNQTKHHENSRDGYLSTMKHKNQMRMMNQESEKGQKHQSNNPVLLIICASGICTCYLYYGMIQEKLFSKNSHSAMKNCGNITTFMLILSCITNVIVSTIWIWTEKKLFRKESSELSDIDDKDHKHNKSMRGLNHQLLSLSSFCYFAAMTTSNESLAHVSYPTAILAKSSKLIPTMIVGYFIERKSFLVKEWFSAALITTGIIIFNLSRMNQQQQLDGNKKPESGGEDSIFGLCLLTLSLAMDGLLATCQNRLKKEERQPKQQQYRKPTALETMLWINAYAVIFLLPLSIWSGQFSNGIQLLSLSNPSSSMSVKSTIVMLNLTAATGQIFIFFTIQLFSPLMCTTITTTRKFLTILLSVWKYGHKFTIIQWFSVGMVFGGLYLGIVSKFVGGNSNTFRHAETHTNTLVNTIYHSDIKKRTKGKIE